MNVQYKHWTHYRSLASYFRSFCLFYFFTNYITAIHESQATWTARKATVAGAEEDNIIRELKIRSRRAPWTTQLPSYKGRLNKRQTSLTIDPQEKKSQRKTAQLLSCKGVLILHYVIRMYNNTQDPNCTTYHIDHVFRMPFTWDFTRKLTLL